MNSTILKISLGYNGIRKLCLSWCHLGNEGALVIAEMLKSNSTLLVINLKGNAIEDDGALAIAEVLKLNSTLQKIDLKYNWIRVKGGLAIAEAMEFNSSLEEIFLMSNRIGKENFQLIKRALEGCINRRKQNARLWICSFVGHWRAEQRLNFDNLMFAFYFYPLLGTEFNK